MNEATLRHELRHLGGDNQWGHLVESVETILDAKDGRIAHLQGEIESICRLNKTADDLIKQLESEISSLHKTLEVTISTAANAAEAVLLSAASVAGEAHMQSYRDAVAHAIRILHKAGD